MGWIPFALVVYVLVAFVMLYFWDRLQLSITRPYHGGHPVWFPFQFLWAEMRLHFPGGAKRRIAEVEEWARTHALPMQGRTRLWRPHKVLKKKQFRRCAEDCIEGSLWFFARMFGRLMASPLVVIGFLLLYGGSFAGDLLWPHMTPPVAVTATVAGIGLLSASVAYANGLL